MLVLDGILIGKKVGNRDFRAEISSDLITGTKLKMQGCQEQCVQVSVTRVRQSTATRLVTSATERST
jgi:hypothetical protein